MGKVGEVGGIYSEGGGGCVRMMVGRGEERRGRIVTEGRGRWKGKRREEKGREGKRRERREKLEEGGKNQKRKKKIFPLINSTFSPS